MRVFVDTNVLLAAALFPQGRAARAYDAVFTRGYVLVVSDVILTELSDVAARKFPDRVRAVQEFKDALQLLAFVVDTPPRQMEAEGAVRDPDDRPILRAAIASGCDVLMTGDKDLVEAGIDQIHVQRPGDFLG